MEKTKYYLGLDMGTSSVGWAVTNSRYELIRKKGKDLWGIRRFEEAKTSADRRSHRISRRRRQREVARIAVLKEFFAEAINEVDPLFYQRMENSKYYPEDKDEVLKSKYGIFNDEKYTDVDYYKQYPTIYHLRKDLIENKDSHDVRLVYLALLNMFKHRGHFLNAELGEGSTRTVSEVYQELIGLIADSLEVSLVADVDPKQLASILSNRDYSRSRKAEAIAELLQITRKEKDKYAIVKAICGLKISDKENRLLFRLEELDEEQKIEVQLSSASFDEKISEYKEILGEDKFQILELMKELYDIGVLGSILKDNQYLSCARVADYDKHHQDLMLLKKVYKEKLSQKQYDHMFREDVESTYSAYVKSVNVSGNPNRRNMKKNTQDDLYAQIKKDLRNLPEDDADRIYIEEEIMKEDFLPKQLTSANGVIPNQVHKKEMRAILKNAENYLPFLKERDDTGYSVSEKIVQLYSFTIPYYVGPLSLNSAKNGNGWVVRKDEGKNVVYPWNIDDIVDRKATSEKFINRLVRRCTYLADEQVMPKGSLLYEKFRVLNEINNLKIDGEKIDVQIKQDIYNELFKNGKKLTKKKLISYLMGRGLLLEGEQLTGVDQNLTSSLSSYNKFHAIFGEKINEDKYIAMAENIVFWCTVYGDSKKFLKEQLEEKYGNELSPAQIKRICGMKFNDWGRLSRQLLELEGCDKSTGEICSIISVMWETNSNFMELLHDDRYSFMEELEKKQKRELKSLMEIKPEDLEDMYFSAPVRRMIWQTLLIMKEIEQVMGCEPDKVFIEMTRTDEEKGDRGRKDSRAKQLQELYKAIRGEEKDWIAEIGKAEEDGTLKSKKMYLYYTQMGKCMYTGKPIDLNRLFDDNLYDIDHIYPRHFVKDDNINNNLVLVYKQYNARKSDTYPIDASIRNNREVKELWNFLREKKLMNEEKYRRLTGKEAFSEEQQANFIARQLVETSQATKGVADLFKVLLPDSKIVYAKARNVSDFRKKIDYLKSRSVNDFHHAQDAYLNIVVGNVYYTKFTQDPINFIRKEYKRNPEIHKYHMYHMFDYNVNRGSEVAWVVDAANQEDNSIEIVRKMMKKHTPLLTYMNHEVHGQISDETLYGKNKAKPESYLPLKATDRKMQDVEKYGGFSSATTAFFYLVEHELKGKKVRTIESFPVYMNKNKDIEEALMKYSIEKLKLVNPVIKLKRINPYSLICVDGCYVYMTGKTGKQLILRNAINLCLSKVWINYIKQIDNFVSNDKYNTDIVSSEMNLGLYDELVSKHFEGIYKQRKNPIGNLLICGKEKFVQLDTKNQMVALYQILRLTSIGGSDADLTLIGGSANSGKMRMNKNIVGNQRVELINQSITGIYTSRVDLLKV